MDNCVNEFEKDKRSCNTFIFRNISPIINQCDKHQCLHKVQQTYQKCISNIPIEIDNSESTMKKLKNQTNNQY